MTRLKNWLTQLGQAFGHAGSGLRWALRTQRNLKIHFVATVSVGILGVYRALDPWAWCVVLLTIAMVWAAELLNTAIEILCDRITKEKDEQIRRIKDISAAAVLVTALGAAIIALIIFS